MMKRTKRTVKAVMEQPHHKHIKSDPRIQKMAGDLLLGGGRPFFMLDKELVENYGLAHAALLSYIYDQFKCYASQNKLQSDGSFFLRHQDIGKKIGLKEYTIQKCKKELIRMGWLVTKMKGVPAKEFYYLNLEKAVEEVIEEGPRTRPQENTRLDPKKTQEYNNNLMKQKPNTINKNPQNHSDSDSILNLFPQEWKNDKSFQESMKDFIQHRKEKGSKLTTVAASKLSKKLTKYSIQEATQALELSMENGWQGVFPESVSKGSANKSSRSKIGTRNMACHDKESTFSTGEVQE